MTIINGLQYSFINKQEIKKIIKDAHIFDNSNKLRFQKLTDREERLLNRLNRLLELLYSGSYDFKTFNELFMPIYDNATELKQKRDLSIHLKEENGKIIIYLNSEYAGTGNGYYYLLDIQNRKKILLDID